MRNLLRLIDLYVKSKPVSEELGHYGGGGGVYVCVWGGGGGGGWLCATSWHAGNMLQLYLELGVMLFNTAEGAGKLWWLSSLLGWWPLFS